MTSYVTPKKNTEYIFYVGLTSQANTKIFQANPTLAAGDAKVSIDGGALANLATLPAVTPAAGKSVKITLSTSEMNGDNITVVLSDAAGDEWCDLVINIQTSARQIDDLSILDAQDARDAMKLTPTAGGGASGSVDYLLAAIAGDVEGIFSDTDEVIPAQIAALNNLSAAQVNAEVVDALTVDVVADSVAADGSRPTIAQAVLMLTRFLMERSVSSTTMTVKKEDGSTSSMTFTLNSASAPTSITRAS